MPKFFQLRNMYLFLYKRKITREEKIEYVSQNNTKQFHIYTRTHARTHAHLRSFNFIVFRHVIRTSTILFYMTFPASQKFRRE